MKSIVCNFEVESRYQYLPTYSDSIRFALLSQICMGLMQLAYLNYYNYLLTKCNLFTKIFRKNHISYIAYHMSSESRSTTIADCAHTLLSSLTFLGQPPCITEVHSFVFVSHILIPVFLCQCDVPCNIVIERQLGPGTCSHCRLFLSYQNILQGADLCPDFIEHCLNKIQCRSNVF